MYRTRSARKGSGVGGVVQPKCYDDLSAFSTVSIAQEEEWAGVTGDREDRRSEQ